MREPEATRARRQPEREARRGAAKGGTERRPQNEEMAEALRVGLRGPAMHRAAKKHGKMREQTVPVAELGRAMTPNEGAQALDDEHGAAEVVGPDGV